MSQAEVEKTPSRFSACVGVLLRRPQACKEQEDVAGGAQGEDVAQGARCGLRLRHVTPPLSYIKFVRRLTISYASTSRNSRQMNSVWIHFLFSFCLKYNKVKCANLNRGACRLFQV